MIIKNGFKEYLLMFLRCGTCYGLCMGIFWSDLFLGILAGLLFGLLFTLFMALYFAFLEKKAAPLRADINKDYNIVCEGLAIQRKKLKTVDGWLFMCDSSLEFRPYKIKEGSTSISLLFSDICNLSVKSNSLIIRSKSEDTYKFSLSQAKLWKQSIEGLM